jgi:hypothetical protein
VKRRSKHLAGAAADDLREATYFAGERGTPINCAISINWALFSGTGISDYTRLARCQERMRHRLERQGKELVWWWVREVSKGGTGAPNTQLSAHNPFSTVEEFEELLVACLEPEGGPNDAAILVKFAGGPIGWWRYCVKGLSRSEAKERGIRAVYQGAAFACILQPDIAVIRLDFSLGPSSSLPLAIGHQLCCCRRVTRGRDQNWSSFFPFPCVSLQKAGFR